MEDEEALIRLKESPLKELLKKEEKKTDGSCGLDKYIIENGTEELNNATN